MVYLPERIEVKKTGKEKVSLSVNELVIRKELVLGKTRPDRKRSCDSIITTLVVYVL